jgi:hypothetical protein
MGSPPFDVRRLSVNFYIQSYFTLCFYPGLKPATVVASNDGGSIMCLFRDPFYSRHLVLTVCLFMDAFYSHHLVLTMILCAYLETHFIVAIWS